MDWSVRRTSRLQFVNLLLLSVSALTGLAACGPDPVPPEAFGTETGTEASGGDGVGCLGAT